MKTCSKCLESKDEIEGFHRASNMKSGRHSVCKPCRIAWIYARVSARRQRNPEVYAQYLDRQREYARLYRARARENRSKQKDRSP